MRTVNEGLGRSRRSLPVACSPVERPRVGPRFVRRGTGTIALLGLLVVTGCGHLPRVAHRSESAPTPRSVGQVDAESLTGVQSSAELHGSSAVAPGLLAGLRPQFPAVTLETWIHDDSEEAYRVDRFRLRTFCGIRGGFVTAEGELFLPRASLEGGAPEVPFIAVSPILGGAKGAYLECRIFGATAAEQGWASFYLFQDKILLKPYQDATDFEGLLRSWTRTMIKATDALLAHYPLDPERLGTFGISLGGIRNVVLAAAEPRFRANVIMIAGGELSQVFAHSQEHLVLRYLARRCEVAGVRAPQIYRDFRANFVSDPVRVASSIDPESVLLFLARWDDKVPIENGWALYEALEQPECRTSPLGHYTSILVLPWAIHHSTRFFREKLQVVATGLPGEELPGEELVGASAEGRMR